MGQAHGTAGQAVPYHHSHHSSAAANFQPENEAEAAAAHSVSSSGSTIDHEAHTDSTLTPSPPRHNSLAIRRHEPALGSGLSYARERCESESTTASTVPTTTSSALPADTSIPTVTEFSDLETLTDLELDYIQSTLDYPRIKTYGYQGVNNNMDLNVSRYENKKKPGQSSARSQAHVSAGKSPKPSKESKNPASKKVDKKSQKVGRQASETSSLVSDSSAHSSKAGDHHHGARVKRGKSDEMKRRTVLGQAERKDSLANRWQNMVDEYQDVYMDHSDHGKFPAKDERKVSKISDYGQYDKVKQVFNKGFALPMQTVPSGVKAEELELESAPSEASVHSWNVMSPGRSTPVSPSQHGRRMSTSNQSASGRSVSISPVRTSRDMAFRRNSGEMAAPRQHEARRQTEVLHHSRMVRQEQTTSGGTTAAPAAATDSKAEQRNHYKQVRASATETKTKGDKKKDSVKRGGMQERASEIVDTVLENALKMLHGSPVGKRKSSSTSTLSAKSNENTSRNVYNHNISRNVHENVYSQNVYDQKVSRNARDQNNARKSVSVVDSSVYKRVQYSPEVDLQAQRKTSGSGSQFSTEQSARRQSQIKVVPRSGQRRASTAVRPFTSKGSRLRKTESLSPPPPTTDVYKQSSFSLGLRPYAAKVDPPHEAECTDPKAQQYFSDSEYSTSLEIKRGAESVVPLSCSPANESTVTEIKSLQSVPTPDPGQKPKAKLPPTLTRGTVTRVLHDGGTAGPEAMEFIAGVRSKSMPSLDIDTTTTTEVWPARNVTGTGGGSVSGASPSAYITLPRTSSSTPGNHSQKHTTTLQTGTEPATATTSTSSDMYAYQYHPPQQQHQQHQQQLSFRVDASKAMQAGTASQHYVASPLSPSGNELSTRQADLPTITEEEEGQYGVFSNEPIIVADLIKARPTQPDAGTTLYGTQPTINMTKRQQLNFYLFNTTHGQPRIDCGEADLWGYEDQVDLYRNRPRTRVTKQDIQHVIDEDSSSDTETEMRPVTIYHKQTQTPPQAAVNKKPKRVSKKPPPSPVFTRAAPLHKEITHYITQQTEIEKLPPEKAQVNSMSVQTEDIPDWAPSPSPPPPPPAARKRVMSPVSSPTWSPVPRPVFTETRQLEEHRTVRSPSPPPVEFTGRDIPLTVEPAAPDTREIVVGQVVPSSSDESSEEEILETTEIEEKEQRIAMAIFEEVEFNVSKTQGGKTTYQSPDGVELEPFWLPDKFEATVERRKKKVTQVKETAKEGQGSKWLESKYNPALEYNTTSAKPRVLEDRTLTASKTSYVSDDGKNYKSDDEDASTEDVKVYEQSTSKTFPKTIPITATKTPSGEQQRFTTSRTVYLGQPLTSAHEDGVKQTGRGSGGDVNVKQETSAGSLQQSRLAGPDTASVKRPLLDIEKESQGLLRGSNLHRQSFMLAGQSPRSLRRVQQDGTSNSTLYPAVTTGTTRISAYDPENVSFGKRSGQELLKDAEEVVFDLNEILQSAERSTLPRKTSDEHLTSRSEASRTTGLDGQVIHSSQSEPQMETRIEKDKDGNLVKITEMKHTLTKTVEYPDEDQTEVPAPQTSGKDDNGDDGSVIVEEPRPLYTGPEVLGETSTGLKPYEYGIQRKTLQMDEDNGIPRQHQYLYDMNTAELTPIQTKDSDYNLIQYAFGDTLMTQL